MRIVVTVDDALRFSDAGVPTKFVMDLKGVLTYDNPDYWRAHAQKFYTGNIPRKLTTFELKAGVVRISRGAMGKLREVAAAHGIEVRTADRRVSVPIDGLKSDIVLRGYQQPAVDAILKREQGIVRGPCGCLTGDTLIDINRGGKGQRVTLKRLYNALNGYPDGRWNGKRYDLAIPTRVRSWKGKLIGLHPIKGVVYSGPREVFRLRLENGREIEATGDHEILCFRTATGEVWTPMERLRVGDEVVCDVRLPVKTKQRGKGRTTSRFTQLWNHPYARKQKSPRNKCGFTMVVEKYRIIYEALLNKMPLEKYLERLRSLRGQGAVDGLEFVDPSILVVHHADGDHWNNDPKNLMLLTHLEHRRLHAAYKNFGQGVATTSRVVSRVCRAGFKDTYDIICEEPHRNFVANGIVVHNCGKTILLLKAIEAMRQRALVVVWNKSPLMDQWVDHVREHFGFDPGVIGGGQRDRIAPITIGMQQTLYRRPEKYLKEFGAIVVDETHRVGASTWTHVVNLFPARYRVGVSADEKRRDRKDFLVYDTMGGVIHEIFNEDLVDAGVAMPVRVRIVPTGFSHRYGTSVLMADGTVVKNRNYTELISDMTKDEPRNRLILQDVLAEMAAGRRGLLLTDRVLAVEFWLRELRARGIAASAMVGGTQNRGETDRARTGMLQGEVQMIVGTTSLCREALDIPCLDRMFITSPVGDTKKLVQMVGRLKRVFDGKTGAECIYYLDERIFSGTRGRIERLFKGLTEYRLPVAGPQAESLPFPEESGAV